MRIERDYDERHKAVRIFPWDESRLPAITLWADRSRRDMIHWGDVVINWSTPGSVPIAHANKFASAMARAVVEAEIIQDWVNEQNRAADQSVVSNLVGESDD